MPEYIRHIQVKAVVDTNKTEHVMVESVQTLDDGEAAIKEFFDEFREDFHQGDSLLDQAMELIRNALLLRMNGDISNMPMSQAAWDQQAEAFLREHEEE
jgi:hypothetical protein